MSIAMYACLAVLTPAAPIQSRPAAAKPSDPQSTCLMNTKQLALACLMLMTDNDDVLRVSDRNWQSKLKPYVKTAGVFTCPLDPPGFASYSMNLRIANISMTRVRRPDLTVLLYEGSQGQLRFRHHGRAAVAYCDGHAKMVTPELAKSLVWKP